MVKYNHFKIVEILEKELSKYTGAPYVVCVDSCTNALGICFEYHYQYDKAHHSNPELIMPKKTYIGVAMQAKRTGYKLKFVDYDWEGEYLIDPIEIWDSARRFYKDMFSNNRAGTYGTSKCVSFHRSKILGHTHGGAILTNDKNIDKYARMMRHDGRTQGTKPKNENPTVLGRHCYMDVDIAAALLGKLYHLPEVNEDLPNDDYPDLSKMEIFK